MADQPYYGYTPNPIIDSLELSTRAARVLRSWGRVNTLEDFMALDRATVMLLPSVGVRTWEEIKRTQDYLRRDPSIETMAALQDAMAGRTHRARSIDALFDTTKGEQCAEPAPQGKPDVGALALSELRDKAALAALQGLCADPNVNATPADLSAASWRIADAFIAAREAKSDA